MAERPDGRSPGSGLPYDTTHRMKEHSTDADGHAQSHNYLPAPATLRRAIPVVAVALLVSLSGCGVIFSSSGGGGPQPPTNATASPTPAATTTDSPSGGGTQASAAPYQSVPGASEVLSQHRAGLADAGNVTQVVISRSTADGRSQSYNATKRLSFETSPTTQVISESIDGQHAERYLAPDGNYTRLGRDDPRYAAAEYVPPFQQAISAQNLRSFTFDGPSPVTIDGETMFRYTVDGPGHLTEYGRERVSEADFSLDNVSVVMVVDSEGVIRQHKVELFTENGGELAAQIRYTDLGATDTTTPAWVGEARQAVSESSDGRSSDSTTVQRLDALPATLIVSGDAENIGPERGAPTALRRTAVDYAYNDEINQSRVSEAVNVTLPATYARATLDLGYIEDRVPQGDEANVTLMRYNATANGYEVVTGAFVNSSRDSIAGPVSANGTYIAVHSPTFAEPTPQNDGSETATASRLVPPQARP